MEIRGPFKRPVSAPKVVVTILHSLGVDLETVLPGPQGVSFGVVDSGTKPIIELF